MQLRELIRNVTTVSVDGALDRDVSALAYDSRRVVPGGAFVAIRGTTQDGHDYIHAALERGAGVIVCERPGWTSSRVTTIRVADAREALAQLSANFHGQPSTRLRVIGVTGTNGKTTVAFMVKHIMEVAGMRTGLIGTVRYEIGDRLIPALRTTPEALEMNELMAQMVRAGCVACVMEVSSHALEQQRVRGVEFDVAIFTNLTQDHLDYHGTMESYFAAKSRLFEPPARPTKRRGLVINLDDAYGQRLAAGSVAEVVVTYGLSTPAVVRATGLILTKDSVEMTVAFGDELFGLRLPLIGRHNVYNALAALGAARALGVPAATVQRAMETLPPVPGRLERVTTDRPIDVYVDYAHTDDALANVLTTLREMTSGRVLLTFGCGGSRDTGKRAKMGRVAATGADFTVVTSDNPRKESAAQIAAQIVEGFVQAGRDNYRVELDRARAIEEILQMAQPGDSVLIAGKGHETYQEFTDTVVPFDDRVVAREVLETLELAIPRDRHR